MVLCGRGLADDVGQLNQGQRCRYRFFRSLYRWRCRSLFPNCPRCRTACASAMGEHHGQGQQQVGHGCFALFGVAFLARVEGLLQIIEYLPDPGRRSDSSAQKGQCRIEDLPGCLLESRPAIFRVGHRLPLCQFDQRVDVGLVQVGEVIRSEDSSAQGQRTAHLQRGQWVGQQLRNTPDRSQVSGEHVVGVIRANFVGQPGEYGFAQLWRMPDGIDQVGRRRVLAQGLVEQRPIEQARSFVHLPGADHEHVAHFIRGCPCTPGGSECQRANDDFLSVDPAFGVEDLHHGSDIAIAQFVNPTLSADLLLQGQQWQLDA
ncbi:hypothetical protein D3C85_1055270 [compost metagenome]